MFSLYTFIFWFALYTCSYFYKAYQDAAESQNRCNKPINPAVGISKAWHSPPMFFAFFCLTHNLREPADFRWRTLPRLCRSRQLSSGRHSISNAHSSCLLLPDAAYTWHHPPPCYPLSYGMGSHTHPPPFFSNPLYRLSIHPFSALSKQIIGLQGKTGVTSHSRQPKKGTAVHACPNHHTAHWDNILIWDDFQHYCERKCRQRDNSTVCFCGVCVWLCQSLAEMSVWHELGPLSNEMFTYCDIKYFDLVLLGSFSVSLMGKVAKK